MTLDVGADSRSKPEATVLPEFLDETEDPVDQDDGYNRYGIQILAQQTGYQGGSKEDQHHEILKLIQEQNKWRNFNALGELSL